MTNQEIVERLTAVLKKTKATELETRENQLIGKLVQKLTKRLEKYHVSKPTRSLQGKKHQDKPKTMNNNEWSNLLHRFEESKSKKEEKILLQRRIQQTQELIEMKSKPVINSRSKRIAQGMPDLLSRQSTDHFTRMKYLQQERQLKEKEELDCLRGKPDVEVPCICGFDFNHTFACWRFVDSATALRKQKKPDGLKRTIEDMLAYGNSRDSRRAQRSRERLAMDDKKLTFSPVLNKNSVKIYETMIKEGRSIRKMKSRNEDGRIHSFRPRIDLKSKKIISKKNRKQHNVFDRLHVDVKKKGTICFDSHSKQPVLTNSVEGGNNHVKYVSHTCGFIFDNFEIPVKD